MRKIKRVNELNLSRKFGVVKWFGGVNKAINQEVNYGFIEGVDEKDIFIHRKEWEGMVDPRGGMLVTYLEGESNGKYSAYQASELGDVDIRLSEWYAALIFLPSNKRSFLINQFRNFFVEKIHNNLSGLDGEEIEDLIKESRRSSGMSIFEIASAGYNDVINYKILLKEANLRITDAEPWLGISSNLLSHFELDVVEDMAALEFQVVCEKCAALPSNITTSFLVYLMLRGVYTSRNKIGSTNLKRAYEYMGRILIHGVKTAPFHMQEYFELIISRRPVNSIIDDIGDNLLFKKSLYDRTMDFVDIYLVSSRLKNNIDTFILYNLLSLIATNNDLNIVYEITMQRVWEALVLNVFVLNEQTDKKLRMIFPSCHEMGPMLSCEAVYWPKAKKFLCRGKPCESPMVLPDLSKDFFYFNIYDWLSHYNIGYILDGEPQSKDFPIKLAGYFNRLHEIFPILHCRSCGELMRPNMKYARTEYRELVNGVIQIKEMSAAYRLTVFHCNNLDCNEFEIGYYINHCLGFGCYNIIDSRDLTRKCGNGLYICRACGSCCAKHAQSNPIGICVECGDNLEILNKTVRGLHSTYLRSYVKCRSSTCSFTISSDRLPSKFSLFRSLVNSEKENPNSPADADTASPVRA